MATILREWSYRYQWLYDTVSALAALSVGGNARFRRLFLRDLKIAPEMTVLDMCCGSGQATEILVQYSQHVIGLDASPFAIARAQNNVPQAEYVVAFAEKMPFSNGQFDLVVTSTALHEMQPEQLRQILQEVQRVLKPGGCFCAIDFHTPSNWLFWPPLALFLWLFETETAWQLLKTDLNALLNEVGLSARSVHLYAGDSLQVVQSIKRS
ncbi:class I SAM-dependent methyltransferase [Pseudanabaena sp. PCC 6802]|uniref:class I SAM-dependent methyltransferase n=1 Tax=Pseudanabaena sp. PCC 6802 TaxID=118173 RepID=UPI000347D44B|nr:class I SAM-dependent methyltransferase [Pseudanabaena sp. PCC 6802]